MSLQERFTGGPEPRRLRAVHRSAACCAEQEIACSASLPLPVVLDASEVIEEAGHDARHAALLVEEPLAPDRRIRRIDLFISRTTAMLAGGSGDYLVALHLYAGSSLHRAVVTMSYPRLPPTGRAGAAGSNRSSAFRATRSCRCSIMTPSGSAIIGTVFCARLWSPAPEKRCPFPPPPSGEGTTSSNLPTSISSTRCNPGNSMIPAA